MLVAGLGLVCLGYTQAPLAQPAELLAVEKWQLTYTYNAQGSEKTGEGEWFYQESASGNALLVRRKEAIYVLPEGLSLDMGKRVVDARIIREMHCKSSGNKEKR